MKLWEKGNQTDPLVMEFTAGRDRILDQQLIRAELFGSAAHARMLEAIGFLTKEEFHDSLRVLEDLVLQAEGGKLLLPPEAEDVHSFIEAELTRKLGDVGKRIHTGRSRNDQVLLDIRLFLREEIAGICTQTRQLSDLLLGLAERHKNCLMPGYTHMQAAMPSSFGLWFSAWAESLTDDLLIMQAAYRIVNQNPLGSGAGYGSSLPIDREMTTRLLGFENMNVNVVYAQMGRGKTEKVVSWALSSIAATLSRMAGDVCLYSGQNFGFFSFPDELTTGSSIMPHKKNPDAWELIRGRCNKIQNLPAEFTLMCANLPTGYHRDYQLLKESLFPALQSLKECLGMALHLLNSIQVKEGILEDPTYDYLFSVEAVNAKVRSGMPFRQAYREVAKSIEEGAYAPDKQLDHSHTGSIGNLGLNLISERMKELVSGFHFDEASKALKDLFNKNL